MENYSDKVLEIKQKTAPIISLGETLTVTTPEEYSEAAQKLNQIKASLDRIEELRKFFVGPLNDHIKSINNEFKMLSEPLKEVQDKLKYKMTTYYNEQERLKLEEAKKAQESETPVLVEAQKQTVRTEAGIVTAKKQWTFEVYDAVEFVAKHPELCSPDNDKIKLYMKNITEEQKQNGLHVYQKTILSSRI